MKVLQIDVVCGVGSTGRIVSDIHNYLKSNKIESCVAYGREEAKNCDKTIKIVGFNKADDDYLEILEGTQGLSDLEILQKLEKIGSECSLECQISF